MPLATEVTGKAGKKELKKILAAVKEAGYSKGGTIGKAIKGMGEDGIILARSGEEILSLEKIKELGKSFQMMNPVLNNIKTMIPNNQIVPRQNVGGSDVNINISDLSLPNVTNYEDFLSEMFKDRRVEKYVQTVTFGNALGKNSLSKYRIR